MNKITEKQAKNLVEKIKHKNCYVKYLGVETVPYVHAESQYEIFPKELKNKQVYCFEEVYNEVSNCQYYIDSEGNIYMDTLPFDGEAKRLCNIIHLAKE